MTKDFVVSIGSPLSTYTFRGRITPEIILLENAQFGKCLWILCKVRGQRDCVATGTPLQGCDAYRPNTDKGNKFHRISAKHIHRLEEVYRGV